MPSRPLREIMLDVHEETIKLIYEIPESKRLHYNEESTQICVDNVPIYKYMQGRLFDSEFVAQLFSLRESRRNNVINAHKDDKQTHDDFFNIQFDYEMLGLDHLVDKELAGHLVNDVNFGLNRYQSYNSVLIPSTGKTFFEEVS